MKALFASALAESALISWRDLSQTKFPPLPSDFAAVIIIWGILSFFPEGGGQRTATVIGWGFVAATFMNLWNPASPTKLALPGGGSTASSVVPGGVGASGTTPAKSTAPGPTGSGGRQGSGPA